MLSHSDRAAAFIALHSRGDPLVLFNIWDAGSAQVVARAGAKAIATGSWSVAAAHGHLDGEQLALESVLATIREIIAVVDLPVTVDLESGYGARPAAVGETVQRTLETGAIGCNLEDRIIGEDGLYPVSDQCSRLRSARRAADGIGVPAFINARTDLFLKADPVAHTDELLEAALHRATAYAEAGASGFFAPGLIDERLIGALCQACPLPTNVLLMPNSPPSRRLAELGVARISYGPGPYRLAMRVVEDAARRANYRDE